jgi:hypothetical protein
MKDRKIKINGSAPSKPSRRLVTLTLRVKAEFLMVRLRPRLALVALRILPTPHVR